MLYEVVYEQKMHPSVTKQQLHRGAAQAGHLHAISLSTRAPALYLGRTGQVLIGRCHFQCRTYSSCRDGRWENILSLTSEKVPLTRLLEQKKKRKPPVKRDRPACPRHLSLSPLLHSQGAQAGGQAAGWPRRPHAERRLPPAAAGRRAARRSPRQRGCGQEQQQHQQQQRRQQQRQRGGGDGAQSPQPQRGRHTAAARRPAAASRRLPRPDISAAPPRRCGAGPGAVRGGAPLLLNPE